MGHPVGSDIPSHDIPARIDALCSDRGYVREIDRSKTAAAQQKPKLSTTRRAVQYDDVAARVDPDSPGKCNVGEINRGEFALAQQKTMGKTVSSVVPSHDVAARVESLGTG